MPHSPTLYDLLEVSPRASTQVIRAAYRCLAQTAHPDKHLGDGVASERQAQINGAYAVLSDPMRRQLYDRTMGLQQPFVERRSGDSTPLGSATEGVNQVPIFRAFAFRPLV